MQTKQTCIHSLLPAGSILKSLTLRLFLLISRSFLSLVVLLLVRVEASCRLSLTETSAPEATHRLSANLLRCIKLSGIDSSLESHVASHVGLMSSFDLGGEGEALLMCHWAILCHFILWVAIGQVKVKDVDIWLCLLNLLLVPGYVELTGRGLPGHLVCRILRLRWHNNAAHNSVLSHLLFSLLLEIFGSLCILWTGAWRGLCSHHVWHHKSCTNTKTDDCDFKSHLSNKNTRGKIANMFSLFARGNVISLPFDLLILVWNLVIR